MFIRERLECQVKLTKLNLKRIKRNVPTITVFASLVCRSVACSLLFFFTDLFKIKSQQAKSVQVNKVKCSWLQAGKFAEIIFLSYVEDVSLEP